MKAIKFLIAMFFMFIIIIFGTANNEKVTINYWMGKSLLGYEKIQPEPTGENVSTGEMPKPVIVPRKLSLWIVIFSCFTLGFLVAYIIMLQDNVRVRTQLRRTKKKLKKIEAEKTDIQVVSASEPVQQVAQEAGKQSIND